MTCRLPGVPAVGCVHHRAALARSPSPLPIQEHRAHVGRGAEVGAVAPVLECPGSSTVGGVDYGGKLSDRPAVVVVSKGEIEMAQPDAVDEITQ